jgi:hypothetical protein
VHNGYTKKVADKVGWPVNWCPTLVHAVIMSRSDWFSKLAAQAAFKPRPLHVTTDITQLHHMNSGRSVRLARHRDCPTETPRTPAVAQLHVSVFKARVPP